MLFLPLPLKTSGEHSSEAGSCLIINLGIWCSSRSYIQTQHWSIVGDCSWDWQLLNLCWGLVASGRWLLVAPVDFFKSASSKKTGVLCSGLLQKKNPETYRKCKKSIHKTWRLCANYSQSLQEKRSKNRPRGGTVVAFQVRPIIFN